MSSTTMLQGPVRTFPNTAALSRYRRVTIAAGVLAYAGADAVDLGTLEKEVFTTDLYGPVRLRTAEGTRIFVASAAITAMAVVYAAANGKISSTKTSVLIGIALTAATADGDHVEVLPMNYGLKMAYGQATTVAASDTIVTGLSTVVAVVASYDTDPADANTFVSASIGDQAGTPAAGSFLLKTWKSADGADVTPVAASAFTKKVNWIALGT